MSLIADALKKAQAGAARALPPFSFKRPASALPGGAGDASGRRLFVLAGAMGVVGLLLISGLYLSQSKPARVRAPAHPLLVVESTPSPTDPRAQRGEPARAPGAPQPRAQVPARPEAQTAAPAPKPEQGTSIPEVRAALEAQPTRAEGVGTRTPLPSAEGQPAASSERADQRREVALRRVKEALEEEAKPTPPPAPPRVAEPPPAPPPILEVQPDGGKEAAKFFATALRHQQQGQLARAIEEYEKSIAADPRNPAAYNNLGVALKESGRLDLAIEAFEKCLALDPKYEKALNNLGVIRYRQGQYEAAIDLFTQALRINPANVESYTNLGIIYLLAQRYDDAAAAFQQALRYDPKLAEAHYNLGLLWERRGNREKAERYYRNFVELASARHADLVAKVRERLQHLARGR